MQITDVRVRKVSKEGKMKAIVSITLDNEFVVHDTRDKIQSIILAKYETTLLEADEEDL